RWMREGRCAGSRVTATRGSDLSAASPEKRESCRMVAEHSSDRSRPASRARIAFQMFDASDPRLYRASQAPPERHFGMGGGPDGSKEEGLEEGRQEGREAFHEAQELAEEVARTFRAASEVREAARGFAATKTCSAPHNRR